VCFKNGWDTQRCTMPLQTMSFFQLSLLVKRENTAEKCIGCTVKLINAAITLDGF